MFQRLLPEAAEFFGKPSLIDTPFSVEPETDPEMISQGSMARTAGFFPHPIVLNETFLPYIQEDELRGVLMHEITHAAVTPQDSSFANSQTGGHGPLFLQKFWEWSGFFGDSLSIRNYAQVPGADPSPDALGFGWDDAPTPENNNAAWSRLKDMPPPSFGSLLEQLLADFTPRGFNPYPDDEYYPEGDEY